MNDLLFILGIGAAAVGLIFLFYLAFEFYYKEKPDDKKNAIQKNDEVLALKEKIVSLDKELYDKKIELSSAKTDVAFLYLRINSAEELIEMAKTIMKSQDAYINILERKCGIKK